MKKLSIYFVLLIALAFVAGCEKGHRYPDGQVAINLPLYDLRNLYKGDPLTLNEDVLLGSNSVAGVVISDHSGGNMPEGLLVIQDRRRLSLVRGISIAIGTEAATYAPGDSVVVNVVGGVLQQVNGILQITGVPASAVNKVARVSIPPNGVGSDLILAHPFDYESTLVAIVEAGFNPLATPQDVYAGDKTLNDGLSNITLHTEPSAAFAKQGGLYFSANYYGIVFNTQDGVGKLTPHIRLRTLNDAVSLGSAPVMPAAVISGWIADPKGTDANNEYIQFLATRDIDFAATPFSVVTTNNAGASTPTGTPVKGWATGDLRTYKFTLNSGTARKGEFFYVGGTNKLINSTGSTSIASANWVKAYPYNTTDGEGFGTKTTNLLANSGNAYGIALFEGATVDVNSVPVDVVFISSGGSLFSAGPPAMGYRIGNTDSYRVKNPLLADPNDPEAGAQPFYRQGTNTRFFAYHPNAVADQGFYYKAGGVFSLVLGKWVQARNPVHILLTKTSTLAEIEEDFDFDVVDGNGNVIGKQTVVPTKLEQQ